jgi:phosphatidylserine/phosphatidylglycerophosphate/cardiolipin synthase-like enzyme
VSQGVTFNAPVGAAASQQAIQSKIIKLIQGAPKGSTISVGMFHFSSYPVANALVAAAKRKVKVRVVLDWASDTFYAYKILKKGLGTSKKKTSWVMLCTAHKGCIASQFNHDKYFVFSRTRNTSDVVVQTSANATAYANTIQWNDALTIANKQVYNGYLKYFADMAAQRRTNNYHRVVQAGKYRVDFLPWSVSDPITESLDKVNCAVGTRLELSMDYLLLDRVARQLRAMQSAGCTLEIIMTNANAAVIKDLTASGGTHGLPLLRYLPDDGKHAYDHSKYLLIDGTYAGHKERLVLTGSVNYTGDSFAAQDEALITVVDSKLEQQYAANFSTVWHHATSKLPGSVVNNALPKPFAED